MGVVTTIPERCRRCYTCVRECPAKAIKVEHGQAMVIAERCIACGNCVKVCAQKAKRIEDSTQEVKKLLRGETPVFACLAPSFPAAFPNLEAGKIIAAVRKLGFQEVWEVAFGAELISVKYAELFEATQKQKSKIISTSCPAIVDYVEKYLPERVPDLAPIVSPMIAVGRAIKKRQGPHTRVVFIGPCIAKKKEIHHPEVMGAVDAVLTYVELLKMLIEQGIVPETLKSSGFDGPRSYLGRSFPLTGGLLKTTGLSTDILENDILVTEGKERVLELFNGGGEEAGSRIRFYDLLFCEGCINGPVMPNKLNVFARKEILANSVIEQNRYTTQKELIESLAEFKDLDLTRKFSPQDTTLHQPSEEEIGETLKAMRQFSPEDQLNCGACGYRTCRDKAIAVCQGLAEAEMCLPYLIDELESTCQELRKSHVELASAQQRLVQSERLASMGQLSAGVAHEINNPLGTVLLYSHMLLKQLKPEDPRREDLEMIVNEATRCKNIVRGLLDFARQSRVSKAPTKISALIEEVARIMANKAESSGVALSYDLEDDLPILMIDETQIKQMLVNLVHNGIDAVSEKEGERRVHLSARQLRKQNSVEITVRDNGCGIPQEYLSKVFTPFFTTKEAGKGTGLGLAIAYGVVKMHCGDIVVDSRENEGSIFTITLPLEQEPETEKALLF